MSAASATLMGAGRRKRRRALWEVSICAVLMAAALLFRMAMYLYRPITGEYLPNAEFLILYGLHWSAPRRACTCVAHVSVRVRRRRAYLVPEQVPAVLGLVSQRVSATRLREKLGVVDFDQPEDMNEGASSRVCTRVRAAHVLLRAAHLVPNVMTGRNMRSVTADDLAAVIVRRDDNL